MTITLEYLYIGRNVLLYCPDFKDYKLNSREFYFDISKDLPLSISYSFESLFDAITIKINNRNDTFKIPEEYKPYPVHEHLLEEIMVRLYT